MKKEVSFITIICIIVLSCSFRSADVNPPTDEKQIIDLYLQAYRNSEFYTDNGAILVLKGNNGSLNKDFVKYIVDKMNKYEKYKKLCEQSEPSRKAGACLFKTNLEKFKNIVTAKELDFFKTYQSKPIPMDYFPLLSGDKQVLVVDSLRFFKTKFDNRGVYINRLQFRGPFFSKDKSKALLEVYDYNSTVYTNYMVFDKKKGEWEMVGNVKF